MLKGGKKRENQEFCRGLWLSFFSLSEICVVLSANNVSSGRGRAAERKKKKRRERACELYLRSRFNRCVCLMKKWDPFLLGEYSEIRREERRRNKKIREIFCYSILRLLIECTI